MAKDPAARAVQDDTDSGKLASSRERSLEELNKRYEAALRGISSKRWAVEMAIKFSNEYTDVTPDQFKDLVKFIDNFVREEFEGTPSSN
jgi:hypothetical protein